ncbi:hypothetical protein L1987_80402 [Smallanthus sonchifolius]|uniref:Uncharacterized protein n=1 Tax=Smallanthus sonchifolius TaxID=185202 RepID=A0ACB8YNM7_9ASTR|nr:hypothetical protein L1987_80402 [Smallanthus sonchifolius]
MQRVEETTSHWVKGNEDDFKPRSRSRPQKHKSSPPPLLRSRHESQTAVPSERCTVTARCRRRRLPEEIGISAGISHRTVYEDDCIGEVRVVPETKVGFSIPVRFVRGGDGEEVYFVKLQLLEILNLYQQGQYAVPSNFFVPNKKTPNLTTSF